LLGRDDPVFASGWVRSKVGEDRSVMLGKNGRIKIGGEEFSVRNKMTRECSESSGCSRVLTIDGVSPSGLKMRIVATGNSRE
jgi:hypothetical protein